MEVGGQRHALVALPSEQETVPILHEAGSVAGPVWTGAENFAPIGIRTTDTPASSESLYWLRYSNKHKEITGANLGLGRLGSCLGR